MRKNLQNATRRTFLKRISGTIAATAIGAAGWSNIFLKNNSRGSSAVFSEGQIGSLQIVKHRAKPCRKKLKKLFWVKNGTMASLHVPVHYG